MGMDAGLVAAINIVAEVGQRMPALETEEDAKAPNYCSDLD